MNKDKTIVPIDMVSALDKLNGDHETLRELAEVFLTCYEENWVKIQQAARTRDAKSLNMNAHRMKSSVGNFFARETHEAAAELERAGREADWSHIDTSLRRLEASLRTLIPHLRILAKGQV